MSSAPPGRRKGHVAGPSPQPLDLFIDASPHEALDRAREAAGDLDVRIGGGPTIVRDFLAADLIDFLHVAQVPMLLGRGVRLWDGLEGIEERYDVEATSAPSGVTHLTFARRG